MDLITIKVQSSSGSFSGQGQVEDPVDDGEKDPAFEDRRELVPGGCVAMGEEEIEQAAGDVGYRREDDFRNPVRLHDSRGSLWKLIVLRLGLNRRSFDSDWRKMRANLRSG
jgi:hypothetical protein